METQPTQTDANSQDDLWNSEAEAKLLENRLNGFWNPDYLTNILLPLLNLKPGSRVLDVGCGSGALTLLLARHHPGVQFVGVDVTASLTTAAQQQAQLLGLTNVEFQEGDALSLPFADGAFEAAVCQTVLIHLSDPAGAIGEMNRVLKSGGTFMAAEYNILFPEMPIMMDRLRPTDAQTKELGRLGHLLLSGVRASGQGDWQLGGRVAFLAYKAGLTIVDVRINDRVTHAFPPYNRPADQAALAELPSWQGVASDPGYRALISGAILAGGGTEADIDAFLHLFQELLSGPVPGVAQEKSDFAFLWLANPILLVTVARKP